MFALKELNMHIPLRFQNFMLKIAVGVPSNILHYIRYINNSSFAQ